LIALRNATRSHQYPGAGLLLGAYRQYRSLPYRIAYLRSRRQRGHELAILTFPHRPVVHSALFKTCLTAGIRLTTRPRGHFDLAIHYSYETRMTPPAELHQLEVPVINLDCVDASKTRIEQAHVRTLGYGLAVDPLSHRGACVMKSDDNALHDGRIVDCPVPEITDGVVYQRVINNQTDDGDVVDIRVPVYGSQIPFVYLKRRPLADRFGNLNTRVALVDAEDILSRAEQQGILRLCRDLGIDYAELDVLRDRESGRIFVVDANPTPNGPPNGLLTSDAARALSQMREAFHSAFIRHTSLAPPTSTKGVGTSSTVADERSL
jgi:hypothetical protein